MRGYKARRTGGSLDEGELPVERGAEGLLLAGVEAEVRYLHAYRTLRLLLKARGVDAAHS